MTRHDLLLGQEDNHLCKCCLGTVSRMLQGWNSLRKTLVQHIIGRRTPACKPEKSE